MRTLSSGENPRSVRPNKLVVISDSLYLYIIFSDQFPLLTTKRVFWKGVLEELLWFIKVQYLDVSISSRPANNVKTTFWYGIG